MLVGALMAYLCVRGLGMSELEALIPDEAEREL